MAHAVIEIKKLDDLGQFLAHEGFAARNPELMEGRGSRTYARHLIETDVVSLIQFLPVETRAT